MNKVGVENLSRKEFICCLIGGVENSVMQCYESHSLYYNESLQIRVVQSKVHGIF